jgi:hypothetical protein
MKITFGGEAPPDFEVPPYATHVHLVCFSGVSHVKIPKSVQRVDIHDANGLGVLTFEAGCRLHKLYIHNAQSGCGYIRLIAEGELHIKTLVTLKRACAFEGAVSVDEYIVERVEEDLIIPNMLCDLRVERCPGFCSLPQPMRHLKHLSVIKCSNFYPNPDVSSGLLTLDLVDEGIRDYTVTIPPQMENFSITSSKAMIRLPIYPHANSNIMYSAPYFCAAVDFLYRLRLCKGKQTLKLPLELICMVFNVLRGEIGMPVTHFHLLGMQCTLYIE